jgi:predicted esterase
MTTRGVTTRRHLLRWSAVAGLGGATAALGACTAGSRGTSGTDETASTPAASTDRTGLTVPVGDGFLQPTSSSTGAKPLGAKHLGSGTDTHWRIELPTITPPKALVIMLHGAGHTADRAFAEMGLSPHVEELGIAIAAVDGGATWWHWRDGLDGLAIVTQDLVPAALAASGLPATTRIGLTGYSMGGYGALLVASELGRSRVRGVIAHAPALFLNQRESPHAFDSQAQFDEFSVWDRIDRLQDTPMWIDCGTEDPFIDNDRRFAAKVPQARTTFGPGDHDTKVWAPHLSDQLRWLLEQPA